MIRFSLILPTHDEAKYLQTLDALDYPASKVEILTLGKTARGEFLVFTSANCIPHPQWLRAFDEAIAANPGCAYRGPQVPGEDSRINLCLQKDRLDAADSPIVQVPQAILQRRPQPLKALLAYAACFLLFALTITFPIFWLGGFSAEFSGQDEAAHLVSGIMVHQYLLHGLPQGQYPMQFASAYYDHYPKVAIGHWPPVFYLIQSLWYLLAGLSRSSVMLLAIFVAALLGCLTTALCRAQWLAWPHSIAAGFLVVLSPQLLRSTLEFSSDPLVALFVLLAAIPASRWLRFSHTPSGLLFAALAATACLIKGNAFPILLLPPLVLIARRDFTSWLRLSIWGPFALALALTLPWYWFQRDLMIHEVVPGATANLAGRIRYTAIWNLRNIPLLAGPIVLLMALLSWRKFLSESTLTLSLLPFAFWLFLSFLSPHTDNRLMLALVPVLCFFAALRFSRIGRAPLAVLALFTIALTYSFDPLRPKPQFGFVSAVTSAASFSCPVSIVVSNSWGEGAWISEFALRQPLPTSIVRRASKLFQSSTWMGDNYQLLARSPSDVQQILDRNRVDCLILHLQPEAPPLPYMSSLLPVLSGWISRPLTSRIHLYERPR